MSWGINVPYAERGVSNVVGVVLLLAITLIVVSVIIVAGYVTINDTSQDASREIAEEAMLQIDSTLQQSDGENASVGIPDKVEGQVGVSNDATYSLTMDGNGKCTTGPRPLSTVEYEEGGKSVAYEGGGVWEQTESGATMTSPPDITYNNGSLSVSFTEISGQITASNEFQVSRNATEERIHQYNMSRALYTDGTYDSQPTGGLDYVCRPSEVQSATLKIQSSQYASAWADWARENYGGHVEVSPAPSSVNPGDTVTITFPLGDVSDTYYKIADLEVNRASASDQPEVTATVTNTGGLEPDSPIEVDLRYDGSSVGTESVQLAEDKSTTVSTTLSNSEIKTSGVKDVAVASPDESVSGNLEFTKTKGVPQIELSNTVNPKAGVGSSPSATVDVKNTGKMTAYETITMYVDGDAKHTWNRTIAPGDTETVNVGDKLPTNEVGTYNVTFRGQIESGDKQEINPFEVGNKGYLDATVTKSPTDVTQGDTVTIEADIENTGQQTADEDVTIEVVNAATGSSVAPASPPKEVDVNLDGSASASGSESTTVSLDYTADDGTGNYKYIIETPYETESGTFTVGPSPLPNFLVTKASISENPVVQGPGNTTTVDVEVTNTGQRADEQDIRLQNVSTGAVLKERTEKLNAGESVSFKWTVKSTDLSVGNNEVNVSTENTSVKRNIQVLESEPTVTDSGGTITVTESVEATVTMEGAELEGIVSGFKETSSPTRMTLVIESSSGRSERTLWEDVDGTGSDVNHPRAEQRMQRGGSDNPYTVDLSLEPGTELSLYATSYGCGTDGLGIDMNNYTFTGIVLQDRRFGFDNVAYTCKESVEEKQILQISESENPDNVIILGDGEEIPAEDQSAYYQLELRDMLGSDRLSDGQLRLADGERVFLYELSDEDATPEEAEGEGDPDYNDAIARFQINSVDKEQTTPPKFVITDQDAPSQVTVGDDAEVELTVGNNGGKAGKTDVEFSFAGNTRTKTTKKLQPGKTDTLTFDLDTSSGGTYEWVGDAVETDGAERSGFTTIGSPPDPNFVVALSGDSVNDTDGSPEADVTVTNTGAATDTQSIVLEVCEDDNDDGNCGSGESFSDKGSKTRDLNPGESDSFSFGLPDPASSSPDQGDYTYRVSSDDTTSTEQELFIGHSDVSVNNVNIGTQEYPTSSLIEREGSVSAMNINLQNIGTVGDERDVTLTIRDQNGGSVVFQDTDEDVGVPGSGVDLTGSISGSASGQAQFTLNSGSPAPPDGDIDPGYYDYTITVYNDTQASGDVDTTVTGEMFLEEVSADSSENDSPITVDSGTVRVGT